MPLKQRKKSVRPRKSTRTIRSARRPSITPLSREFRVGAAALGILGIMVIVMMVAARPHARTADMTDADARPATAASNALIAEATAPSDTEVPTPAAKDTGTVTAPVTITGCLERSDDTFRLKDTEGDDAPRARSWKSGFLKKSPASIQVVDGANRVKLPAHVGHRVTVTGTLIDRELRVRSLHPVALSCGNTKTKV